MKALTLITTRAGKLESVAKTIRGFKKGVKEVLVVTGRADIAVFSEGSIADIRNTIMKIGRVRDVVTTETMFEIEMS